MTDECIIRGLLPSNVEVAGPYPGVFEFTRPVLRVKRGSDHIVAPNGDRYDLEPDWVIDCESCGRRHVVSMRFTQCKE